MAAWIPAAIAAGGSILGGLAGKSDPEQIGFGDIYGPNAGNALRLTGEAAALPGRRYFQGDTVANMLPGQQGALNEMIGFGGALGGDIKDDMYNQGQLGLGALGQGSSYLDMMAGRGAPQFQYDQGLYDQTMQNLGPGIQGLFDSGAQRVGQNLNWNTLPGLNLEAAMGGNLANSGLASNTTLATDLAQQNLRDFGLGLWDQASGQAQQAAMTGGQQNLGAQLRNDAQFLSGAQGVASQGIGGLANASTQAVGNMNLQYGAGAQRQAQRQAEIGGQMAKYDYNRDQPYNDIAAKLDLINPQSSMGQYGPNAPNAFGNAISGLQTAGGLYDSGMFNFLNQPQASNASLSMPGANSGGINNVLGQQGVSDWYTQG